MIAAIRFLECLGGHERLLIAASTAGMDAAIRNSHMFSEVDLQTRDVADVPLGARYVIAQDGKIAYAEVSLDYTLRLDPGELVTALQKLKCFA